MSEAQTVDEIANALGGKENIKQIDACLTRLRVILHNNKLLNKSALKKLGAVDVVSVGNTQQIIFGAKSMQYRDGIKKLIGS